MSIQVFSQEAFILINLEEQVRQLLGQERVEYSLGIEFGVAELVRVLMRQLAQRRVEPEGVLLARSLETVEAKLNERLSQGGLTYDFTPYFAAVRKGLRFAAREISELSQQLDLSRRSERVATRRRVDGRTAIPLELVQVGLQNAIEALLVIPLAEEFELNLEGARAAYEVEGQWFPYRVIVEEFSIVLDDDGTILVATLNLSDERLQQAQASLLNLAEQLYRACAEDLGVGDSN